MDSNRKFAIFLTLGIVAYIIAIASKSVGGGIISFIIISTTTWAIVDVFWADEDPVFENEAQGPDLEQHRKERKRLSENHYNRAQSLVAWLLATLVAVNGAAAVAIMSRPKDAQPPIPLEPALIFVLGVILAILSGFFSWREAQDRTALYYFESLPPQRLNAVGTADARRRKERAGKLRRAARQANYASLVMFVCACGWIGWRLA